MGNEVSVPLGDMDFVTRKQQRLCYWSEQGVIFRNLYQLLETPHWIRTALEHVLQNRGSRTPGVDGLTAHHLEDAADRERMVSDIVEAMRAHAYRPQPVRRIYIPKSSDPTKLRPLGIPTIQDRCVQEAVRMILEPIYEPRFYAHSYGFRPFRSAHHALARIHQLATAPKGPYTWVIEGDIRDCFGHIDHERLMATLRRTIADRALLAIIRRMLKAGALENLRFHETEAGTPQGGVVSPLLANIYLHALDQFVVDQYEGRGSRSYRARLAKRGTIVPCSIVRYADDFVVLVRGSQADAEALKESLAAFLQAELGMELAAEKTLVTPITQGFDFLGYTIRAIRGKRDGRRKVILRPSRRSIRRFRDNGRRLFVRWGYPSDLHPLFWALNAYLRGWSQYFSAGVSKWTFNALDAWLYRWFARWLLRRHQGHRKYGWRRILGAYRMPRRHGADRVNRASRAVTLGLPASGHGRPAIILAQLSDTPIRYGRLFGPYCPYRAADRQHLRQRRRAHTHPTGLFAPQWLW